MPTDLANFAEAKLRRSRRKPKFNLRVEVKDVFYYHPKTGVLMLGGEAMAQQQIKNLQAEIAFIDKSYFWQICNETLRYLAIEKMVYKSESFDDMRNGKEMMEVLKLINQMFLVIKSWKPKEMPKIPSKPIQH